MLLNNWMLFLPAYRHFSLLFANKIFFSQFSFGKEDMGRVYNEDADCLIDYLKSKKGKEISIRVKQQTLLQ